MNTRTRAIVHASAAILVLLLALYLVHWINAEYWNDEPFPGGRTAREAMSDCPWLETGIARLVRTYTVPLGLMLFISMYGALAAMLEMKGPARPFIVLTFICGFLGCILPPALLLFPIGILIGTVFLIGAMLRKNKKVLWFSAAAIVSSLYYAGTTLSYWRAWFDVFGD
jgi:hypothetical protein